MDVNGATVYVVDDLKPAADNVLWSSLKTSRFWLAGTVKAAMTLVPVADKDQLVTNNTFKCPVAGWWMIWMNYGSSANTQTFTTTNAVASAWYKVNNGTEVILLSGVNIVGTFQMPVFLQVGDTVSFTAINTVASAYKGTYCFEFIQ